MPSIRSALVVLLLSVAAVGFAQHPETVMTRLAVLENRMVEVDRRLQKLDQVPEQLVRVEASLKHLTEVADQQEKKFYSLFVSPIITGVIALGLAYVMVKKNGNGKD